MKLLLENDDLFKLDFTKFDQAKIIEAYEQAVERVGFTEGLVNCINVTKHIDGGDNDPRGIFWTHDQNYDEIQVEKNIDERKYTLFENKLKDTYFHTIYQELSLHFNLGRVRILKLGSRKSLSFHRDPEPRIHVPIITNPGALMIIENFAGHLKANGNAYFVDTRKYHTALNGGNHDRIHMVATILKSHLPQKLINY
jgi:hypothetical protein